MRTLPRRASRLHGERRPRLPIAQRHHCRKRGERSAAGTKLRLSRLEQSGKPIELRRLHEHMCACGTGRRSWGAGTRTAVLGIQRPACCHYTTPQMRPQSIGRSRSAATLDAPWPTPFTVLIMAAGQGTRMRSDAAQGAPPDLRQADGRVGRSTPRARRAPARACASCGPATAWPRGCPTGSRSPSSTRARAPAPPCSPRATLVEPGPLVVLSGDHPLVTAEQIDEPAARAHARRARPRRCSPPSSARPRRLRPHRPRRRRATFERIVETKHPEEVSGRRARHPRDQPRHLRLRGAGAVRGARPGRRPGRRALPHRRLPGAQRPRARTIVTCTDRRPRHRATASTTAPG